MPELSLALIGWLTGQVPSSSGSIHASDSWLDRASGASTSALTTDAVAVVGVVSAGVVSDGVVSAGVALAGVVSFVVGCVVAAGRAVSSGGHSGGAVGDGGAWRSRHQFHTTPPTAPIRTSHSSRRTVVSKDDMVSTVAAAGTTAPRHHGSVDLRGRETAGAAARRSTGSLESCSPSSTKLSTTDPASCADR